MWCFVLLIYTTNSSSTEKLQLQAHVAVVMLQRYHFAGDCTS